MRVKNTVAVVVSFLLCVSISGVIVCLCAGATLLNREKALDELSKQDYYNAVYNTILNDYESIGIPSGIPVEVFAGVLNRDTINNDIRNGVDCLYIGSTFLIDTETIKSSLKDAFQKYAKSINADISDSSVKEAMTELENYCASRYAELIRLPFMNELSPYVSKAAKAVDLALTGCIAISIVFLTIIFLIQKMNAVKYMGASLMGSGLATLIPCVVVLANAPHRHINIGIESFYKFAVNLIESGLQTILMMSVAVIVLGIIAIAFSEYVIPSVFSRSVKNKYAVE